MLHDFFLIILNIYLFFTFLRRSFLKRLRFSSLKTVSPANFLRCSLSLCGPLVFNRSLQPLRRGFSLLLNLSLYFFLQRGCQFDLDIYGIAFINTQHALIISHSICFFYKSSMSILNVYMCCLSSFYTCLV